MKKLLLVLAIGLAAAFSANAQWYVGGSLHFGTDQTVNANGEDAALIQIAPEVGYWISDKLAVGGAVSFDNSLGVTFVEIMPYVRYSLLEMGPVSLFLDGQLGFAYVSGGGESNFGFAGVGVAPGIAIPVGDHLSFVGHLGRIGYYGGSFEIDCSPANIGMGLYYAF